MSGEGGSTHRQQSSVGDGEAAAEVEAQQVVAVMPHTLKGIVR